MVADTLAKARYWDASLPVEERVADLVSHMTLEEKAGQLLHWIVVPGTEESLLQPNAYLQCESTHDAVRARFVTTFALMGPVRDVRQTVRWHNALQRLARDTRLGIPVTLASDPRHHWYTNAGVGAEAGCLPQWPETLGLAALRDPATTRHFAETANADYRALGIRLALHPQIDLATDYRWARIHGTFGEDAALTADLAAAYIRGFQNPPSSTPGPAGLSSESVACMVKHFPGGGALRKGEDSHFRSGSVQEYPGGQFDTHLQPFVRALEAGAAQVMPAYGVPTGPGCPDGTPEVAFGFNKPIVTGLLRDKLGFQGVVVTDFGLVTDHFIMGEHQSARAWGCEHLDRRERVAHILDAGCDQLGGEQCSDLILDLVRSGRISQQRVDESVARILRDKFLLGLFENPFLDEQTSVSTVGAPSARAAAAAAQRASVTILENSNSNFLPLSKSPRKVYLRDIPSSLAAAYDLEPVTDPKDADLAILRLQAPFETRPGVFAGTFHSGSLAFPPSVIAEILAICATTPTIIDIYLDRPAILTPFVDGKCAALVGTFGTSPEALLDVLFGVAGAEPRGKLPFDLPRSMEAVEGSLTDMAGDTEDPVFRFGHGLEYRRVVGE